MPRDTKEDAPWTVLSIDPWQLYTHRVFSIQFPSLFIFTRASFYFLDPRKIHPQINNTSFVSNLAPCYFVYWLGGSSLNFLRSRDVALLSGEEPLINIGWTRIGKPVGRVTCDVRDRWKDWHVANYRCVNISGFINICWYCDLEGASSGGIEFKRESI